MTSSQFLPFWLIHQNLRLQPSLRSAAIPESKVHWLTLRTESDRWDTTDDVDHPWQSGSLLSD